MHDFGDLLTIIILQVAVAILVMTWLRSRTRMAFLWVMGWLLVLVRAGLTNPSPWQGAGPAIAGECCVAIAMLLFLDSLLSVDVSSKIKIPMAWVCAAPLGLFLAGSASIVFSVAMLGTAALVLGIWAIRSGVKHKFLPLSLIGVTTFWASSAVRTGHPGSAAALVMSALFLAVGVALARGHSLRSSGSVLAVSGFVANSALALWLPLQVVAGRTGTLARAPQVAWILTAIGMAILLIEDEGRSIKRLQQRERLIREELQHYAAVQVTLQVDADEQVIYKAACDAMARFSPFKEVAMLKRDAGGRPKGICHSTLQTVNIEGIERLTQRYTAGDPALLVSFQGARSVVVRCRAALRLPHHKTPGRNLILSLPAQSGKSQGWLWLASPVKGWGDITAEQLLPLETLASRMAVSMENRELTRMLIRNDKLAGLGKLAGGLAHELNNPLTVVYGYTEIIHESTLEPCTRKQTAKVMSEAMRMKRIIEDLNRFSKAPTTEYGSLNLVDLIRDVHDSLQSELIRRGVSFELHATQPSLEIYGCRDSLHQVFFQLVLNAAEAIERSNESHNENAGRIRAEIDQNDSNGIVLVSDTGPGFAEPERIFDPFYTTKEPGEGPGLGLSVSYGLVQEHHGHIHAYNLQPGGAAVCVSLPLASAPAITRFSVPDGDIEIGTGPRALLQPV